MPCRWAHRPTESKHGAFNSSQHVTVACLITFYSLGEHGTDHLGPISIKSSNNRELAQDFASGEGHSPTLCFLQEKPKFEVTPLPAAFVFTNQTHATLDLLSLYCCLVYVGEHNEGLSTTGLTSSAFWVLSMANCWLSWSIFCLSCNTGWLVRELLSRLSVTPAPANVYIQQIYSQFIQCQHQLHRLCIVWLC